MPDVPQPTSNTTIPSCKDYPKSSLLYHFLQLYQPIDPFRSNVGRYGVDQWVLANLLTLIGDVLDTPETALDTHSNLWLPILSKVLEESQNMRRFDQVQEDRRCQPSQSAYNLFARAGLVDWLAPDSDFSSETQEGRSANVVKKYPQLKDALKEAVCLLRTFPRAESRDQQAGDAIEEIEHVNSSNLLSQLIGRLGPSLTDVSTSRELDQVLRHLRNVGLRPSESRGTHPTEVNDNSKVESICAPWIELINTLNRTTNAPNQRIDPWKSVYLGYRQALAASCPPVRPTQRAHNGLILPPTIRCQTLLGTETILSRSSYRGAPDSHVRSVRDSSDHFFAIDRRKIQVDTVASRPQLTIDFGGTNLQGGTVRGGEVNDSGRTHGHEARTANSDMDDSRPPSTPELERAANGGQPETL
ncbi:hypothetical protein K488DRAFT_71373 [Vararia minispora EC-137]|uniref:Uncharacterized protein n=1 Tax=Vararia minispora EC-137 TaxID=1314806 RepID=A0ACB8QI91_9AGAM|nr:hypothetical protein K488DRAFT_71373 [Vararia minispora EC-137]